MDYDSAWESIRDYIVSLEGQVDLLDASIVKKDATITVLNQTIVNKDAEILTLKNRIKELEGGTTPPVTPEPPVTPPSSGLKWPKSANTGTKGSLTSRAGGLIVTRDGDVIENLSFTDTITVRAKNVVIRNCKVKATAWYGILQDDGSSNLTVENVEIDGTGSSGMTGIAIQAGSTIRRCNVYGMVIGIKVWGPNFTVEDNYIHDLAERKTDAASRHFDGIANLGASNGVIQRNAIIMPPKDGGTAGVFISSQQGSVSNVKVLSNLLTGQPSYQAYAEKASRPMSGVVFDGNYIEKGIYGYILNTSGAAYTNNVQWDDAVGPVPDPVKAWRSAA